MSAVFDVEKLLSEVTADRRYHEFLRISTLSSGLYVLAAGATDKFLWRAISITIPAGGDWMAAGKEFMRAEPGKDFGYQP